MTTGPVTPPGSATPQGVKPDPIRIKLYGLFTVTRRSYLTQLGIAGILLAALVFLPSFLPLTPPGRGVELPEGIQRMLSLLRNLPWIALGVAVLFGIEACFVFRRFRREEARRQTPSSPQASGAAIHPDNQP